MDSPKRTELNPSRDRKALLCMIGSPYNEYCYIEGLEANCPGQAGYRGRKICLILGFTRKLSVLREINSNKSNCYHYKYLG